MFSSRNFMVFCLIFTSLSHSEFIFVYDVRVRGFLSNVIDSCLLSSLASWWLEVLCSVQFSCSVVSDSLKPQGLQHARPPHPSSTSRACSDSCPVSQWCHPTISSSVVTFSTCLQSFPATGSFLMSQFFTWRGGGGAGWEKYCFQLQHQFFQWIFSTDFLQNGLVWSLCNPGDSWESLGLPGDPTSPF